MKGLSQVATGCEACGRLTLDAGKIEAMIIMTENQEKKARRFPKRAALCVTAAAAEVPAVQEFFTSIFVTITVKGEEVNGFNIPSVAVEEREGREAAPETGRFFLPIFAKNGILNFTVFSSFLPCFQGGLLYEADGHRRQLHFE